MEIPHFKHRLDSENTVESIKPVLKQIRPEWDIEKVKFKEFSEGISNKLVGCNMPGLEPGEMILFRLYGNKTELFIDRQKELETFQILHSKGYGPPVYGTLENGLVYGFLPGDVLDTDTIADKHISSLCARHMAKLHAIKVNHEKSRHKAEPMLFTGMMKYLNLLPEKFEDQVKNERWEGVLGGVYGGLGRGGVVGFKAWIAIFCATLGQFLTWADFRTTPNINYTCITFTVALFQKRIEFGSENECIILRQDFCTAAQVGYVQDPWCKPWNTYHLLTESEVITGKSQTKTLMYYIKAEVWDFPVMTEGTRLISYSLLFFFAILKKSTMK